jgi:hypothetical protein
MKLMRAVLSGLVAFLVVAALVIAGTYLRCLVEGITYNFSIVAGIAIKGGAVPGGAIFLLSLIGAPRRYP